MIAALVAEIALTLTIGNLDAARFRTRESAHRAIRTVGEDASVLLLQGLSSSSQEIRQRCRQLLDEVGQKWAWRKAATVHTGRWHKHPWIHFGSYASPETRQWLHAVHAAEAPEVEWEAWDDGGFRDDWQPWRTATRHWIATRLLAGQDTDTIRFELAQMADAEAMWWLREVWWGLRPLLPERL